MPSLGDGLWVLLVRPAKGELSASPGMARSLFNLCLEESVSIKATRLAVGRDVGSCKPLGQPLRTLPDELWN